MNALTFVNCHGTPITVFGRGKSAPETKKASKDEFFKGWRVVGLPPGSRQEAEAAHAALQKSAGLQAKSFDANHWLMNAKKKPVRAKPYELEDAARVCAELARKAGWIGVEVRIVAKQKGGSI